MQFQLEGKKNMKIFDGAMLGSSYGSQIPHSLMSYCMYEVTSLNPPMLIGICNP